MNVTEKFKSNIKYLAGNVACHAILNMEVEHEGKRYAFKIVELDAELPEELLLLPEGVTERSREVRTRRAGYTQAQLDMINDGWVKGEWVK